MYRDGYYMDGAGYRMYSNRPMRYGEPGRFTYMPGYAPMQTASQPGTTTQQSFYYGPQSQNAVLLDVRLPVPDAQILIDGTPTTQRGTQRLFISPPLEPGKTFTYELSAKFLEGGKEVTRLQKQEVRAGERVTVDFTKPQQATP
jgi:uncharacterized protein (TIGR03000 family)